MMKEQLKTLQPYKPGKNIEDVKAELGLEKVVKLASNENPFGSSPNAIQGMERVFGELMVYPDGYAADLREKVSRHLGVSEDRLIFGNGTDEIIHILSRSLLEPGTNTIMADLTFPQYKRNAVIEGAEVREVPLKEDGRHDLEAMLAAIDDETRIIWLCNPNNPTGEYIRDHELRTFLDQVPAYVTVVCDEAYFEYVTASDFPDAVTLSNEYRQLFVTRTFSKAYGLAALRIGYGVGHADLVQGIEPAREPFNASRLAQAAAVAALDDHSFVDECSRKNRQGLEAFYDFCDTFQLKYFPSQTNFILIDFGVSGDVIYNYLLKQGYIVRSGEALGYPNGVRITIGTEADNEAVIQHLKDYIHDR